MQFVPHNPFKRGRPAESRSVFERQAQHYQTMVLASTAAALAIVLVAAGLMSYL